MTENLKEDPLANAFEAMLVGPDAFVTGQEARGQAKLITSDQLPTEGDWDALEELGFVKGEVVEDDPLFRHASLPEGWEKRRTGHSLWTDIVDERGVKRVSVGYKAAFYDRWAQINVTDVGRDQSGEIIYGEDPVALPDVWGVLTDEEKRNARQRLVDEIEKNDDFIRRFGDSEGRYEAYSVRARAGIDLMEGQLA